MKSEILRLVLVIPVVVMTLSGGSLRDSISISKFSIARPSPSPETTQPMGFFSICRSISLQVDERIIWQGITEKHKICWTNKDLYVTFNGTTRKYFSSYAQDWFQELGKIERDSEYQLEFRIHSVVGNNIAVQVDEVVTSKTASMMDTVSSIITIDLSKSFPLALSYQEDSKSPNGNGSILDLFTADSVYSALIENDEIIHTIGKRGSNVPKNLNDLLGLNLLIRKPNLILEGYALNKFRFDKIEFDRVFLSLELLDNYNMHQGEPNFVSIEIPINKGPTEQLIYAFNQKSGFMFDSAEKQFVGKSTLIIHRHY